MARKIILFLIALVVPGGFAALVVAAIASWARKRYRERARTKAGNATSLSREDATIEARAAQPERNTKHSEPMFGSPIGSSLGLAA